MLERTAQKPAMQFAHPYLEIERSEGRYRFICGYAEGIVCQFYPHDTKRPIRKELHTLSRELQAIARAMHAGSQLPEFNKAHTFNMSRRLNSGGRDGTLSVESALQHYNRSMRNRSR